MIVNKLQVPLDLLSRIAKEFGRLGRVAGGLHTVQNGGAGHRQIVEVVLEFFVA